MSRRVHWGWGAKWSKFDNLNFFSIFPYLDKNWIQSYVDQEHIYRNCEFHAPKIGNLTVVQEQNWQYSVNTCSVWKILSTLLYLKYFLLLLKRNRNWNRNGLNIQKRPQSCFFELHFLTPKQGSGSMTGWCLNNILLIYC